MSSSQNILLLEDDESLRIMLKETLEDENLSCMGVGSAVEAVEAAKKYSFDIMLSDIRMAGEHDGLGAIALIKRALEGKGQQIKCIVMTGYANSKDPYRALAIDIEDYLYKPFTPKTLFQTIETVRKKAAGRSVIGQWMNAFRGKDAESLKEKLYSQRTACFRHLWVAVRSRILTADQAQDLLGLWAQLYSIEFKFHRRQDWTAEVITQLTEDYQQYLANLKDAIATGKYPKLPPARGSAENTNRETQQNLLKRLLQKIDPPTSKNPAKQTISITLEDFHDAIYLLVLRQANALPGNRLPQFTKIWAPIQND